MSAFEEKPGEEFKHLRHVSDTAWLVASLRAVESERGDALFKDPYARQLAGRRGPALVEAMAQGHDMSWFMAIRTRVLDELTLNLVQTKGLGGVVNLACGLDARAYRLALPPSLLWLDVDLPDVIDYRAGALRGARATCRVEQRAVDLSDDGARRAVLRDAARRAGPLLVITEGLLLYLTEDNVAKLAADLAGIPEVAAWMTDFYAGRAFQDASGAWREKMRAENAEIRFLPPDGQGFFPRHGWQVGEARSFLAEGERLGRRPTPMSDAERAATGYDLNAMWPDSSMLILEPKNASSSKQRH